MENFFQVSKFLSLLLLHKPEILGLEIDNEGFCSLTIQDLVKVMSQQPKFSNFKVQDLNNIVDEDQKGRYQIVGNKIRALYGHSIPVSLLEENILTFESVSEFLYHGTSKKISIQSFQKD